MQGLDLLRKIRMQREDVPIVVLSSRGDEAAKVEALDLGADDYVTKPFGMEELLARMRAALRHQLQVHGERPVFKLDDLSVDLVRRIVNVGDNEVKLSPKEYELLRTMVQHAGKVLTHKFLLNELWSSLGCDGASTLKPSTTSQSISFSCFYSLNPLTANSSMRWHASHVF
jgi:two-component system KDP operon response regulator KdpE